MKKRCNIYIDEDNVEFLHENNKNISQLTDKVLSIYIDLMKKSENELIIIRKELSDEINEKSLKLKMIDMRLIELADEVD